MLHSLLCLDLMYAKCSGGITTLIDDRFPGNAQEYKVEVCNN